MSREDAFRNLEAFYSDLMPDSVDAKMLSQIRSRREQRRQKFNGAVAGFSIGGAVALTALLLAARPSQSAEARTMASIARLQMIHSGLAVRGDYPVKVPR